MPVALRDGPGRRRLPGRRSLPDDDPSEARPGRRRSRRPAPGPPSAWPPASRPKPAPAPEGRPEEGPGRRPRRQPGLDPARTRRDAGAEAGVDPGPFLDFPAFVIKTEPATGATDVDPALAQIRVTFSREISDGSWSWAACGKDTSPEFAGKIRYEKDRRTCVAPVKLEPDKLYAVSLNSQKFTNFRDAGGRPAVPYMLVFKTRK